MSEVKRGRASRAEAVALLLGLAAPGSLSALWLAPRPAMPVEPPGLALRATEVVSALREAHAFASRAPDDALEARRRELYLASGRAELAGEDELVGIRRRAELAEVLAQLAAAHGDDVVRAVRARDVERMLPALAGEGDLDARAGELGQFPRILERWSAVVGDRRIADELVVRTLFAARWNASHSRPLEADLSPLERRAYHGWLAFHGEAADAAMRSDAFDAYLALAPDDEAAVAEARGVLAFQSGEYALAEAAFRAGHVRTGSVRLRNLALEAAARAAGPE